MKKDEMQRRSNEQRMLEPSKCQDTGRSVDTAAAFRVVFDSEGPSGEEGEAIELHLSMSSWYTAN